MRAKIVGSTNPLNVVQATLKGLTSQVGIKVSPVVEAAKNTYACIQHKFLMV